VINVSFNLSEVRPKEARALSAMLAVIGGAPELNLDAQLGDLLPNDLARVSAVFKSYINASLVPNAREKSACADDCVHPDHHHLSLPEGPVQPECPLFAGCPETPQTGRPEPAEASQAAEPVLAQPEPAAAPEPIHGPVPADAMQPVRRKRRTKEQMEADEAAPAVLGCGVKNPDEKLTGVAADPIQAGPVTAPVVASAAAAGPAATTPASASEPTGDDLRAALKVYAKVHGMPKAIELIKDFGCERISELETRPITDRLEFMKLASNA
jgi:hypothetical protein